jgi:large subunit ribosomal protein L15
MRSKKPHHKKRKRIGRGPGSGHGKTSTKGHKGQHSRSGFSARPGFEGGHTPIYMRVAKRGFTCPTHKKFAILNLDQLSEFKTKEVSPEWLLEQGVLKKIQSGLKILGRGTLKSGLTVRAHRFSGSAKKAIEAAGGQAVVIKDK